MKRLVSSMRLNVSNSTSNQRFLIQTQAIRNFNQNKLRGESERIDYNEVFSQVKTLGLHQATTALGFYQNRRLISKIFQEESDDDCKKEFFYKVLKEITANDECSPILDDFATLLKRFLSSKNTFENYVSIKAEINNLIASNQDILEPLIFTRHTQKFYILARLLKVSSKEDVVVLFDKIMTNLKKKENLNGFFKEEAKFELFYQGLNKVNESQQIELVEFLNKHSKTIMNEVTDNVEAKEILSQILFNLKSVKIIKSLETFKELEQVLSTDECIKSFGMKVHDTNLDKVTVEDILEESKLNFIKQIMNITTNLLAFDEFFTVWLQGFEQKPKERHIWILFLSLLTKNSYVSNENLTEFSKILDKNLIQILENIELKGLIIRAMRKLVTADETKDILLFSFLSVLYNHVKKLAHSKLRRDDVDPVEIIRVILSFERDIKRISSLNIILLIQHCEYLMKLDTGKSLIRLYIHPKSLEYIGYNDKIAICKYVNENPLKYKRLIDTRRFVNFERFITEILKTSKRY